MKLINRIDAIATGILLTGALNSSVTGLTKTSVASRLTGRNRQAMKLYYGIIGAATTYKAIRLLTPKTKTERRVERIAQVYDQAETYNRRAQAYQRAAQTILAHSLRALRSKATS
jgi:uncharacterized membrane protein YuzA (DUF378 family)